MLNPVEEREIGMSKHQFNREDVEIITTVQHEMAIECGEVVEIESDSGEEEEGGKKLELADAIKFCASWQTLHVVFEPPDDILDITRSLKQLHIHFKRLELMASRLHWITGLGRQCDIMSPY